MGMAATQRFCAMLSTSPATGQDLEGMGCCAEKATNDCPEEAPRFARKPCCSFSTTHQKLDVVSVAPISKVQFTAFFPAQVPFLLRPVMAARAATVAWPLYSDASPPLTGRQLLQRLHTLHI
ncbi:hypothetical protein TH63_10545 [Rufibacter radiotolerans]|uniref:Uncharacterized protein n=1 Tax=Rufibacter radiotolerans TaxID=1379910 RepID=A0A0H4VPX3_9BACT|nr:hypothetical protein TH63_10545 [Rufibacter radiotolerans]